MSKDSLIDLLLVSRMKEPKVAAKIAHS